MKRKQIGSQKVAQEDLFAEFMPVKKMPERRRRIDNNRLYSPLVKPKQKDVNLNLNKSFGYVTNKQQLFRDIRHQLYRIDPSEEFQNELDLQDKRYANDQISNFIAISGSLQNAMGTHGISPMDTSKVNIDY